MSDLISRQAAIDIADDLRACISVWGYWAWTERLKKLPSAQPEIIKCKDCAFWDGIYCVDFLTTDPEGYCSWAKERRK